MRKILYLILIFLGLYSQGNCTNITRANSTIQGIVEPFRSADISPEISGRIVDIVVPEGRFARRGDTLIKIEYTEEYLLMDRAKMIANNDADLKAIQLKVETSKLEFEATKLVFDSTGAVSEEVLWGKKYQYEAANAEYEKLLSQKKREQIEYKITQARLNSHFIIAPYSCTVARIKMRKWEHCKAGEPLVTIVDTKKCQLIIHVPISMTQHMTLGSSIKMEIDTEIGMVPRTGIIKFISPVVDPASDLLKIKIVFKNSDGSIKPGVTGFVKVGE